MADETARLREILGDEPPAGVAALPGADAAALGDLLQAARTRQDAELDRAFRAMLKQIPFPVRAIAKRMLFS